MTTSVEGGLGSHNRRCDGELGTADRERDGGQCWCRRNNGSVLGLGCTAGVGAWSRLTMKPASVGGGVSDGPRCQWRPVCESGKHGDGRGGHGGPQDGDGASGPVALRPALWQRWGALPRRAMLAATISGAARPSTPRCVGCTVGTKRARHCRRVGGCLGSWVGLLRGCRPRGRGAAGGPSDAAVWLAYLLVSGISRVVSPAADSLVGRCCIFDLTSAWQ